jgi:hypothetical protein
MAKTRAAVIAAIRTIIMDELEEGTANEFSEEQIGAHLEQALAEVSEKSPAESRETLTTTPGSRDISMAGIDGLLAVVKGEYPVGREPPAFRNATLFGTNMTLQLDSAFSGAFACYAWCLKCHTLSETDSTLKPNEERVLIDGAAAYTALSWAHTARGQVAAARAAVALADSTTNEAAARIAAAVSDLGLTAASAASASGRISDSLSALERQEAAAGAMGAFIGTAQNDLASARGNLASKVAGTEGELASIAARIGQSLADLSSSRGYIDMMPVSGAPGIDYARAAGGELDVVSAYLAKAKALLSEISAAGHYEAIAAREQSNADIYAGQAGQYGAVAGRELEAGALYLSQAAAYSNKAARELEAAQACLAQAGNSLRSAAARFSIAGAINTALRWGEQKLALYKRELKLLEKPRTFQRYPKD